jgi:Protein kinase domain
MVHSARLLVLTWVVIYSGKDKAWKLADFGLTSEVMSQEFRNTTHARGTPGYRAPELLLEEASTYNTKVDVWALGIVLYELAVGKRPFSNDLAVLDCCRNGEPLVPTFAIEFSEFFTSRISKHIRDMTRFTPSERPTASSLYNSFSQYHATTELQLRPHTNFNAHRSRSVDSINIPPRPLPSQTLWRLADVVVNATHSHLITGSYNDNYTIYRVQLWDLEVGTPVWTRRLQNLGPSFRFPRPAFNEGGKLLAVYVGGGLLEVLEAENAVTLRLSFLSQRRDPLALAIGNDGRIAVCYQSEDDLDASLPADEQVPTVSIIPATDDIPRIDQVTLNTLRNPTICYLGNEKRLFVFGNSPLSVQDAIVLGFCYHTESQPTLLNKIRLNISRLNRPLSVVQFAGRTDVIVGTKFVHSGGEEFSSSFKSGFDLYDCDGTFVAEIAGVDVYYATAPGGLMAISKGGPVYRCRPFSLSGQWIPESSWSDTRHRGHYVWKWGAASGSLEWVRKIPDNYRIPELSSVRGVVADDDTVTLITEDGNFHICVY